MGSEIFVLYVDIWEREEMAMDLMRKAQIEAQVGVLIFDEAPTVVSAEYSDCNNIFLPKNTAKLSEHTGINDYAIKLEESKQPLFELIYSLRIVELEILKTYIKANLANSFI